MAGVRGGGRGGARRGRIRQRRVGEGGYADMEARIQALLAEDPAG